MPQDGSFDRLPVGFAEQVALPASQWTPEFRKFIERRTREGDRVSPNASENEQAATFSRYLRGLQLQEEDLCGKSVLDLGAGDGEFVRECLDRNISSAIYGLDVTLDDSALEEEYKTHLFKGNFQEKLPKHGMDYVVSVGAVSNGVWGGEDVLDVEKTLRNALDAVKDGGEVRIFPIQEAARETPLAGLERSETRWREILEKLSLETGATISLGPVDIKVTGDNNDIILEKVLIIKKPIPKKPGGTNSGL